MKKMQVVLVVAMLLCFFLPAQGQVQATLRAATGLPPGQVPAPNTPGGGVVVGTFLYVTDAVWGFRHYQPADPNNPDPINSGILVFDNANDGRSIGGTELVRRQSDGLCCLV